MYDQNTKIYAKLYTGFYGYSVKNLHTDIKLQLFKKATNCLCFLNESKWPAYFVYVHIVYE